VPLRSDPLDELQIPDGTTVEEHDLVTDGDVIVGGQSTVEFGVRGHNVIGGERVRFGGDIEAEADCRLDMWSDVAGNVLVGRDAYLGERVHVGGQLMVSGDLDIGDDVDIEDGFEANGWIVIRNPMPTIVFLFVYLSQLLRMGEQEAAEELMRDVMQGEDTDHDPIIIPRNSRVSDDAWRVSTHATIGDDCRLHGNVRAESLQVGADNEIFGSLRAKEDIHLGTGTEITGDVTTRSGIVVVEADVTVRGDIAADDVQLHEDAHVEGSIRARGEMIMVRDDQLSTDETSTDDDQADESEHADHDGDATTDDAADEEATTDKASGTAAESARSDDQESDDTTADDDQENDEQTSDEQGPTPATASTDEPVEGTERVTALDGSDPDTEPDATDESREDEEYRENGHEDPAELAE
jgi:predicted acyltransferase (DUF342 family)